ELANLRLADVDVVRAGQIVVLRRAQEAVAFRQRFEHALGEDQTRFLSLRLQDAEYLLLFTHSGRAGNVHLAGDLRQARGAHLFELRKVGGAGVPRFLRVLWFFRWVLCLSPLNTSSSIQPCRRGARAIGLCRDRNGSRTFMETNGSARKASRRRMIG